MITVANPIYDVVFKYLMADERIARTILSALLKRDITSVQMRPHEYVNDKGTDITILRIDFAATVLTDDGKEQLVHIEVQKTWLDSETQRFRRYLAVQYENPDNMRRGHEGPYAVPMIMVYLLGHRVGDIEEPVLYVQPEPRSYDGKRVTHGVPNQFVDSLTHESVIVQIPLLHGQVNTKLDRVLSIFEQTHKVRGNAKLLNLDDTLYEGDADMQRILSRLSSAAADPAIRHDMATEEELFSEIDKRDEDILIRDRRLAEQKVLLDERQTQLDEQKSQIDEQKSQIDEQKSQIDEQKSLIRTSVKLFADMGLSADSIAAKLGISEDTVQTLLS